MHNNLMKRYEKELRANMENVEVITKLNVNCVISIIEHATLV